MRLKQWFFIIVGILVIWFLFIERTILPPFILAAIFAYLLNPIINFFSKHFKISRTISILFIYGILLSVFVLIGTELIKRTSEEGVEIVRVTNKIIDYQRMRIKYLPYWLRPSANDLLLSLRVSNFVNRFPTGSVVPLFSQAISRIVSFFIFLFSGYYFLKDGANYIHKCLARVPKKYRLEVEILLRKINYVLSGYLRGQLFLVFLMSFMLYIILSIIGVQFALTVAIFSGFAEIVPVIGPIIAGAVAVTIVLLTGRTNFGLDPFNAAIIVIFVYFILRQLEDYFIIPYVMQKITKLPPFIIFFAVIAGGHIAGILGLILAVPTAAIIRLLFEFFIDKILAEEKIS